MKNLETPVKTGRVGRYAKSIPKGPFTQAIFVAATQCNFCRPEIATSKSHV